MMNRIISILLLLAFFSFQSYHSLMYLNYYLNKAYYANVLCENKDNPEKPDCNGKCHLKKQLDQQKPVQKTQPFSKAVTISFYPEILAILLTNFHCKTNLEQDKTFKTSYITHLSNPYSHQIFHPPENRFSFS